MSSQYGSRCLFQAEYGNVNVTYVSIALDSCEKLCLAVDKIAGFSRDQKTRLIKRAEPILF